MYNKVMEDGKSMMQLKEEFGGAMDMKTPMDMKSPMEHNAPLNMKSPMDMAEDSAMDMAKDGPMNLNEESPKKLTQDAAMKMTSAMKKLSPMQANAFLGALNAAKEKGAKTFEVDGKTYDVK